MAEDTLRKQVSRELKRALSDAGLSTREAARRMKVQPKTLYRWINEDNNASVENLALFARHVGPIRLDIGGHNEEEPPPDWAKALPKAVADAVVRQIADPEMLARAAAELRLGERPPDEPRSEEGAAPPGTGRTAPRRPG